MPNLEIRIRKATDAEARVLTEIPFRQDAINSIIPTLTSWGVVDGGGRMYDESDVIGQFVDTGTEAYFEVVLGLDE